MHLKRTNSDSFDQQLARYKAIVWERYQTDLLLGAAEPTPESTVSPPDEEQKAFPANTPA